MVRDVRSNDDELLQFHLTIPAGESRDFYLEKWSARDQRQRLCIRRFLRYMEALALLDEDPYSASPWTWATALESYWGRLPDEA